MHFSTNHDSVHINFILPWFANSAPAKINKIVQVAVQIFC